jgi:Heterokaryon incompatibility protein (HET)/SH3 domain
MMSYGLEQRWALYDSHGLEEFPSKDPGDLTYFRGDLIEVLEITNEHWALGLCRQRFGVFPIQQTTPGPFVQALTSYTARDTTEISFVKGNIMPAAPSSDPARYTLFRSVEYGLGPRVQFATVGSTPSVEERQSNPSRYYQYSEIERNQIRLIYITLENVEQFIASGKQSLFITIHHASLEEVRDAVAFSYCWGDPNVKKAVFANGKLLYIPSTLWRALRWQYPQGGHSAYSLPGSREDDRLGAGIFWADAICINQNNVLEKNHQIPLMGAIYSQARQVLVYVNEANNSLATLAYMQMITEAAKNHDRWTVVSHDIISQKLGRVDWDAVQVFFTQAVFRRSWVIQEIVLATNITICYGTTRLKLDHIQACIDAIWSNHIRPANLVLGVRSQTKELHLMDSGVQQLFNLAMVKSSWLEGNPVAFMEVLRRFRGANATDPRDKVYSLLSLAPEKYKNGLVIDYSASNTVADVYKQLARCAIETREVESLLLNAGISQTVAGLPTWVPDWSYEPQHIIASKDSAEY